jgi:hypothetical protein
MVYFSPTLAAALDATVKARKMGKSTIVRIAVEQLLPEN